MPRGYHFAAHNRMEAAKAALHVLPVVPNGVPEVSVRTFSAVARAGLQFAKEQGDLTRREAQRIDHAVIWIAYRCTGISLTQLANTIGKNHGAISLQVRTFNKLLVEGTANEIVDGILQILVQRGDAKFGIDRPRPDVPARPLPRRGREATAEATPVEVVIDPRMAEVLRLRKLKWSINGIAKRTGVPLDDVARVCGVEINARI